MSDMAGTEDDGPPRPWQSAVVVALGVLVIVHSAVIALWLAPSGPLRSAASPDRLASYVDPYFRQAWSSLDPSRQRVDERLRIRARISTSPDEFTTTPWIDVTTTDLAATRHSAAPPRVRLIARRLATNLNASFLALDERATKVARSSFTQERDSATRLRAALRRSGASEASWVRYANNDRMVVRFASLYAVAVWGSDVREVQYASGLRLAPTRGESRESVDGVAFTDSRAGWRRLVRPPAAAQERFDDFVTAGADS